MTCSSRAQVLKDLRRGRKGAHQGGISQILTEVSLKRKGCTGINRYPLGENLNAALLNAPLEGDESDISHCGEGLPREERANAHKWSLLML